MEIKRIDIKEFQEFGYLQEANRQFFHPLGLALEVIVNEETGEVTMGGIWDFRDDPEGVVFADGEIDQKKTFRVQAAWNGKRQARYDRFGYMIQNGLSNERRADS
jgi:hypothetical protein